MTADGSLSTALSNFVFEKLGLNSFMKETPCDRSEPPYSINKLNYTGWSSGMERFLLICLPFLKLSALFGKQLFFHYKPSVCQCFFIFLRKECPARLPLFKIRGTTNCNIKNTCTAVSCCVEVGKVGRTFEFVLDVDFCNQKFTVGIEKLVEEVSLNMFEYGKNIHQILYLQLSIQSYQFNYMTMWWFLLQVCERKSSSWVSLSFGM